MARIPLLHEDDPATLGNRVVAWSIYTERWRTGRRLGGRFRSLPPRSIEGTPRSMRNMASWRT